jgi:hypothetical protein
MLFIVRIFYTHTAGAFSFAFTTVGTVSAVFALLVFIEAASAVFTEMILPASAVDAVFPAAAVFTLCILDAAFCTKSAFITKFSSVTPCTSVTLFANEFLRTFHTMGPFSASFTPVKMNSAFRAVVPGVLSAFITFSTTKLVFITAVAFCTVQTCI